jgi:hypothetical protein
MTKRKANDRECLSLLRDALSRGVSIDDMKSIAKEASSWTNWRHTMQDAIDGGF